MHKNGYIFVVFYVAYGVIYWNMPSSVFLYPFINVLENDLNLNVMVGEVVSTLLRRSALKLFYKVF